MKKNISNNKGFTLVELLATIAILAIVMGIATFSITAIIKNSKEKNYQLLITNIKDAAETYYQECKYTNNTGITCTKDDSGNLNITLEDLLKYGYLKGNSTNNDKNQTIVNPNDNVDISKCQIEISYSNGTIEVEAIDPTGSCPTEYNKKGVGL